MAELRGYFWDAAAPGTFGLRHRRIRPRIGNAGDLFNRDLVAFLYGATMRNTTDEGRRLLLVGSLARLVRDGDVVCGIGTRGTPIPPPSAGVRLTIRGVRGPLSLEAFAHAGHDVRDVRFQLDPGLLADTVFADLVDSVRAEPGRTLFVPHYRERRKFRSTRSVQVFDVDSLPVDLAREILRAEHVYASSLHGVVFAHALGRPCTLVAPTTQEPEIKYRDYYASLGLPWPEPVDLHASLTRRKPPSPADVRKTLEDFDFPTAEELHQRGILDGAPALVRDGQC
ncbi:polysaccharide pyruvyl transferase family protein [Georgenia alba]|uniref:Polysaccharide pyruvyl transferase family protein n=1 Tax=Georgenia alba TaxID=2233858 RepID=A0ABW2Q608_9MICO